jgi:hypothetical protein
MKRRSFFKTIAAAAAAVAIPGSVPRPVSHPAAISIPFKTIPINMYIKGPRYKVMTSRAVTPIQAREAYCGD